MTPPETQRQAIFAHIATIMETCDPKVAREALAECGLYTLEGAAKKLAAHGVPVVRSFDCPALESGPCDFDALGVEKPAQPKNWQDTPDGKKLLRQAAKFVPSGAAAEGKMQGNGKTPAGVNVDRGGEQK